jgi:cell division protein FtsB
MNSQDLINLAFGAVSSVLGWFARELWSAVKDLKSDLAKLREELPKTYVTRDDYKDDIRDIKEMLTKLFDRLDNKADKP